MPFKVGLDSFQVPPTSQICSVAPAQIPIGRLISAVLHSLLECGSLSCRFRIRSRHHPSSLRLRLASHSSKRFVTIRRCDDKAFTPGNALQEILRICVDSVMGSPQRIGRHDLKRPWLRLVHRTCFNVTRSHMPSRLWPNSFLYPPTSQICSGSRP
jgi:hypothetical protein